MLISQPTVMWTHGRFWVQAELACCWFASLFPKLFFSAILTWSFYVITTQIHENFKSTTWAHTLTIVAVVLYALCVYTYFKIIMVGPGSPLDFPQLHDAQEPTNSENPYEATDGSSRPLRSPPLEYFSTHTFKNNQPAYRFCQTCGVWKPDRCHHCSTCQRCALKMDHHCPWFACCIGFKNQKYFIQLLTYITLYSGFVFALLLSMLWKFFVDEEYEKGTYLLLNLVFVFVVGVTFFVAVGVFNAFQIYMVLKNTTTIEFQDQRWDHLEQLGGYEFDANGKRQKIGHIYDLGHKRNWQAVMGTTWVSWLLPFSSTSDRIDTSNNGIVFEVNEAIYERVCQSAQLQEQLNQQLTEYRDRVRGVLS